MWPFEPKPDLTAERRDLAKPSAPCGNNLAHHEWTTQGWACPVCAGIAKRKREEAKQDALAEKIVEKLCALNVNDRAESAEKTVRELELESQRNELMAALESVVERFWPCVDDYIFSKRQALDKARTTLMRIKQSNVT